MSTQGSGDVRYTLDPAVIITELDDGTGVLLHMKTKYCYVLNATAVHIWTQLSGTTRGISAAELTASLVREFEVDGDTAAKDIRCVLRDLVSERLVHEGT